LARFRNDTYLSIDEADEEAFLKRGRMDRRSDAVNWNLLAFARQAPLAGASYVGDYNMNFFNRIGVLWTQYRQFRATISELSQLSDAELKDIGLYRGDIINVAYEEAEKSAAASIAKSGKSAGHVWGGIGQLKQSH